MTTEYLYNIFLNSCGITTDSRTANEGGLFIALKGARYNGHVFVKEAIDKGCRNALIDDEAFAIPGKTIRVDNTLTCLQKLANYHRRILSIHLIAITGTNGKTTTKELTNSILQAKYKVYSTKGNLNNHIGVPLTLLSLSSTHEIGIIEMGANHPGEIQQLCDIAEPDFGLITNIGKAHMEGFGSYEGVKNAKNELYKYLIKNNKPLFINYEDETLKSLLKSYKHIIGYGSGETSWIKGKVIDMSPYLKLEVTSPRAVFPSSTIIQTKLNGIYNLQNILAAICMGLKFNVSIEYIVHAIESYVPDNNRSQVIEKTPLGNQLILDCYNANPTSMQASLSSFADMPSLKKVVILGDMLELGEQEKEEHAKIIRSIQAQNFHHIILVGSIFSHLAKPSADTSIFNNVGKAKTWLKENSFKDTSILIKGSRGIKLEELVEFL